jgi:glutathione S-transferase
MASIVVCGFPGSTYVQIVRLVLTPFEYVPILRHGDFTLYETSAIVSYIDERSRAV